MFHKLQVRWMAGQTPLRGLMLLWLLVIAETMYGPVAVFGQTERELVESFLNACEARRAAWPQATFKSTSDHFVPKEGSGPDLPGGPPLPPKDIAYESTDHYYMDFARGLFRHDWWTFSRGLETGDVMPHESITVFDAISRKTYVGRPSKNKGFITPDVSLKENGGTDDDWLGLGREHIVYCLGYLVLSHDDGLGWQRTVKPELFVVHQKSPLHLRFRVRGEPTSRIFTDLEIEPHSGFRIIGIRGYNAEELKFQTLVTYATADAMYPSSWKTTMFLNGQVSDEQRETISLLDSKLPDDEALFSTPVIAGMTVRKDNGYFRVEADGKTETPISVMEVAHGPHERKWLTWGNSLIATGLLIALGAATWWFRTNK